MIMKHKNDSRVAELMAKKEANRKVRSYFVTSNVNAGSSPPKRPKMESHVGDEVEEEDDSPDGNEQDPDGDWSNASSRVSNAF